MKKVKGERVREEKVGYREGRCRMMKMLNTWKTHTRTHAHTRPHTHTHMHSLSISPKQQSCRVIEQHSDTGITQLVAKTILVTVVHPLAHPEDGHGGRVLRIICEQLI